MSKTESAKPDTSVSFRTSIGGQALIEGILMRGPTRQAIVCRTQDGMVEKVEELHWVREKHPILGWPLIRGVIVFLDSMVKGMKALTYSADLLPEDEQEEPGKIDLWIEKHFGEEKAKGHHYRYGRGARHRAVDRAVHPDPDAARRPDQGLYPQPRCAQPL
ncbi:MAG: DUF1385 domain-containing protein [Oscillospiraceae bacterium]